MCMFLSINTSADAQKARQSKSSSKPRTAQTTKKTKKAQPVVDKKTQLRNEKAATEQALKKSQQQAVALNRSIRSSLDSVLILDNHISHQQRSIDSLNSDIQQAAQEVERLTVKLDSLTGELSNRKSNYSKAFHYLQRHRKSVQQKLLFIFSASSLDQLIRRSRYVLQFSTYQREQGEVIRTHQQEVQTTQQQLTEAKRDMEYKCTNLQEQQQQMQSQRKSQQEKVQYLNQNLTEVQQQIKKYQQREAALDAEIDRIIKAEIAEAQRRANAERKRKEEAARRKAEAKHKRALEAKRKAKTAAERKAAQAQVKAAEKEVHAATAAAKASEKAPVWKSNDNDNKLSRNFAANKGRLPMPVTGSYSIVGHYGQYRVSGLRNVTLDNKGIDIRVQPGAQARAVFNGTVSSIFQYNGQYIVMIRHGNYISVYSGLKSVSVQKEVNVTTRQPLGVIGKDDSGNNVLHFQLRNLSARLNPEAWVR